MDIQTSSSNLSDYTADDWKHTKKSSFRPMLARKQANLRARVDSDQVKISAEAIAKSKAKYKKIQQDIAIQAQQVSHYLIYKIAPGYRDISVSYEFNPKGNRIKQDA